jgi:hypothetical protein
VYPHWTYGPAEYGWVLQAKQINHGVQIEVYYANGVDLDVDSNNDGKIDTDNGPAGSDDPIEADTKLPGVIVPVGGDRAKMVVDVPKGMKATLAFDATAAGKVKVFSPSGTVVLDQGMLSTPIVGGGPQNFWIEAFAPSASMADIAFTLTPTGGSPASGDTVRATAVATNLVAHRTGDFHGQPIPELQENRRDPNEFIVLTNNDFDAAALVPDDDAADDEALDVMGVAPNIDDDLMRVTLKRLPLGLPAGLFTYQIVLSDPRAVRLFREDGSLLYVHRDADDPAYDVRVNSPGALLGVVGAPGAFEFLAALDVDIWVEALTPVPSFSFDIIASLATNARVIGLDGFTSRFAEIDMRAQSLLLAGAVDTPSSDIPETARFRFATTNLSPAATTVMMSNAAGPRQATLKTGGSADGFLDIYYGRSAQTSSDGALQFDPDIDDLIPTTIATPYDSHSRLLSGSSRGFLYYAYFHKAYGMQDYFNDAAFSSTATNASLIADDSTDAGPTALASLTASAANPDPYADDDRWQTRIVDTKRVFPGTTADDGHGHAMLSYYRAYTGGYGQFLLETFLSQQTDTRNYDHQILVANLRQGWWSNLPIVGSGDVVVNSSAPPRYTGGPNRLTITIHSGVSPATAGQLLSKELDSLSDDHTLRGGLINAVMTRFSLTNDPKSAAFYLSEYKKLLTASYNAAADAAEEYTKMYYRSVAFVSTGADLVITMNDLAHGDLSAIIGGIPIVGRAAASTLGRFRIRVGSWVSNVADTAVCRVFRQGCFDGETPVLTESGSRLIRDIGPGTRVWAYDTAENRWFLDEVVAAHAIPWMGTMVRLDLGTGSVLATDQHPVWVVTGADLGARPAVADLPADEQGLTEDGRWVAAIHVRAGDTLLLADGSTAVVAAVSTDYREQTVYTLTVANAHTFAVGDMGLLVHNGPACTEAQFNAIRDSWQHFMKCEYLRRTDGTVEILYKTGATNKSLINAVRAFNNGGQLTFDVPGRGPTTITFTGGFADFRPFMYGHPQSRHTLKTMGIDSTWDIDEAWKASGLDRKTLEKDWVWHHTEKLGELILVDRAVHTQVKHTGGAAIFHTMLQRWADLAQLRPDLFSLSDAPLP